ncbi:hypothetical protein Dsin_013621 [Dipteronia sinensis]|uniref:Fe2OG dioxygenase domain-containing protein n=1 Tax=Dipteronia sinensis TaxID=43782 RepID=A0AAE0E963_9ROSI|nr:hypothetical protein Dsin_013621 [Dipteronia sinensis]
MGSQSPSSSIPVIDLSNEDLKPGTNNWVSTCKEIRHAMEEFGCFEAIYSKVSVELHNQVFDTSKELFDLPTEIKMKNTSTKPYFDYCQFSTLKLFESLGIDNPTTLQSTQSFTNLMWPLGNDRFCESARSYSELVVELDKMVIRMLFESYGLERCCESYIESINYLLRYINYRTPEKNESPMGLNAHADKSMTTIIHQNHINALKIRTRDNEWIDVQPSATASSFIVMAGDALMAWSNDRILPCYHKVIMRHGTETRYSLGMFSFSNRIIEVPHEFVDDKSPLKYKPFNHFEFLHFIKSQAGSSSRSLIKGYCGI